ncbi:extracellular solute-binding protein [Streptomyces cocklensis]|uniref:Carbohydrate ABC transporter substrate-binding protein, CUT1 family n=1 Tax=Actinacidiphila cocklensis TaxID=887465 RepID=A0A9W4DUI7_9ACTN|nr:extracellular solute-binding protein [Actinacidiphila cocklensis]MDD1057566.1 extracellular solute-binding protein [Actinacidiphila cocklensis]CAG6393805.1 Carbohydrate ABC transporter substrate-binding protein, CUT1 family [Actinacidiphila cocklensis]
MNVQRRRLVSLVAAGLGTVLAATALSGCSAKSDKDVTLHMVAADYGDPKTHNSSTTYWNDLVKAFEKRNPHIKVDVQVVDWDHVDDKVATMVKAGKAPDIAQIGSYADYAADGLLYSADDIFSISMQADFIPSLVSAGTIHRVQYGIPWVSSSRLFFYNKGLFKEAGIKRAPATWADVAHDAAKLKEHGVKVPYGLPLGTEEAQAESLMWMLGASGGYTDSVGGYTFDSVENVAAFKWLKDNLVSKGLTGPGDPAKTNRRTVFADFLAGDAGMLNGHPTLLAQAKAAHIDVGVAALPGQKGTTDSTLGVADWMMAFKQKDDHLAADSAFLRYVYSAENSLKFLDQYGLLPVTTSALQAMERNPKDADMRQFLERLPAAVFYPVDKTSWGPVSDQVKKLIGTAVDGDPKQVLGTLQRFAAAQVGK